MSFSDEEFRSAAAIRDRLFFDWFRQGVESRYSILILLRSRNSPKRAFSFFHQLLELRRRGRERNVEHLLGQLLLHL